VSVQEDPSEVRCSYGSKGIGTLAPEDLDPLFETDNVEGRPMRARFVEELPLGVSKPQRTLVVFVHVVGQPSPRGGYKPIRDRVFTEEVFRIANGFWSQACIKLVPYYAEQLVTTFEDLPIAAFIDCLAPEEREELRPYDVTAEGATLINLYFVEDTNGLACGSPTSGHVILPTTGKSAAQLGHYLAHEIGHVLLNPLGVDTSTDPKHLMWHPPSGGAGLGYGLFLSDCLGAHARAAEYRHASLFAELGIPDDPIVPCIMLPLLGNNLVVIERMTL
jgi:hypothetical protein